MAVLLSLVVIGASFGFILAAPDDLAVTGEAEALNTDAKLDFDSYESNVVVNDATKLFSGYVWSEDLGWVVFGTEEGNVDGPVSVNADTGVVSGKAKVLSTGNLIDFNENPRNSNVHINSDGEFIGFAWSDDLGWLDFTYAVNATGITLTNPEEPSNVQIYDVSDRDTADYAIVVRWQNPAGFNPALFDTFLVEKSVDEVVWTQVAATDSRGYMDTEVATGTTYYYRIKTQYLVGTTDTSETVSLDPTGKYTSACTLTSGPTAVAGVTTLAVTWSTNRECDSYVKILEDGAELTTQGSSEQVTAHEVAVVGLKAGHTYSYQILSTDIDNNLLEGEVTAFTTGDSPSIYEMEAANITLNSAIINFKSTSVANFTLYYGKTTDYGLTVSESSGSETTNHSIALKNLEEGTVYYYRVLGLDSDGNELRSENSFSTLPRPEISKFKIEPVKDQPTTTLKITWETNVETSTVLKYSAGEKFLEKSDSKMSLTHEVILADLADASNYQIYAQGRDQFGNLAESEIENYETPKDSRSPKISDLVVESANVSARGEKAQIAVSWSTDELATSAVEYGAGVSSEEYTAKTTEDKSLTKDHVVIISDLESGKPYHLRALSRDNAGNEAKSEDNKAVSSEAAKSVMKIILDILTGIFGWMGKFI